ncbi:MAG: hypothetical protein RR971_05055 [Alistipes sp.]
MIRLIILSACGVLTLWNATAQDVILKRNADEIQAVVTEISDAEVRYKKFNNPQGVTYVIPKSDIFSITYKNGEKEHFAIHTTARQQSGTEQASVRYKVGDLYERGRLRGLVIYTTDDGLHGLMMSLEESSSSWGGVWDGVENVKLTNKVEAEIMFTGVNCGCTDMEDGWKNMQTMEALIKNTTLTWSNFPAFLWCRNLGEGWYLPARKEIELLWNFGNANPAHSFVDHLSTLQNLSQILARYGGKEFFAIPEEYANRIGRRMLEKWKEQGTLNLWTSTERNQSMAYVWVHTDTKLKVYDEGNRKDNIGVVRAFHKF